MSRILHMTFSVGRGSTGLGSVALESTKALVDLGVDAMLWTVDDEENVRWASRWSGLVENRIRGFRRTGFGIPALSCEMIRASAQIRPREIAIVHQHGMWSAISWTTNRLRRKQGVMTIVAPHGSLHPNALSRSRWKKAIALSLYERENLQRASCLHAVSTGEISAMRSYGLRNPIAVIPNGVSDRWLESEGDATRFRLLFSLPSDKRVMLFLSRVSPGKGLLMLLDALDQCRREFKDWCLVIAGADEFDHRNEVERAIREKGFGNSVMLVGALFDQVKRDAFAAAELFVLPSFNEAGPIVVLEALGAQLPVITTKASPWPELQQRSCGWWTDMTVEALTSALKDAFSRSSSALHAMGLRGKAFVRAEHTWTKAARMNMELYGWLLGEREQPSFVETSH